MTTVTEKACSRCNRTLPASAFSADATKPGGLRSQCRDCCNPKRRKGGSRGRRAGRQTEGTFWECVLDPDGPLVDGYWPIGSIWRRHVQGVPELTHWVVIDGSRIVEQGGKRMIEAVEQRRAPKLREVTE